ncbi:MAG TPA: acetoin utilization AcuC family protein [Candidatus Limnocylindrales bacterium]|nr:acetoin utilization AcuC family protein [Candidatus Limnocylindrales bacterium]
MRSPQPLLVFGPRSLTYDFGPQHPLTPRRFGPGIDLLRAVGAEPNLAPEPAPDRDLLACHAARYIATVRAFSEDPFRLPEAGISAGDNPPFAGMHEASASVAGGSLAAADAILRGEVVHAFHPGGGLHHAMPDRASGFCIYDDPALAIARFRAAGLRVLYVDFDTHHGDGVQAIHLADPGVLTFSIHESGEYLFPGTGSVGELGAGEAAGTSVNVPLEPFTGEKAWLAAVRSIVPALAATFGPDVVVSQHGADSHAWDPLAHLRVTTTAMGEAARLVDRVAHRFAGGRWLATGGGGYDAYRVVPRTWSLVWLAGAHLEVPAAIPEAWRDRWTAEAERYYQAPLPERFEDEPNAGRSVDADQRAAEERSTETAALVRTLVLPAIVRIGIDRGWLDPIASFVAPAEVQPKGTPTIVALLDAASLERLTLAPRTLPLADVAAAKALLAAAVRDGGRVAAAVAGDVVVGVAAVTAGSDGSQDELIALGVAPGFRRRGLATALLRTPVEHRPDAQRGLRALVTVAERDPIEPLARDRRAKIARRLLESAGFRVNPAPGGIGRADPDALEAVSVGAARGH